MKLTQPNGTPIYIKPEEVVFAYPSSLKDGCGNVRSWCVAFGFVATNTPWLALVGSEEEADRFARRLIEGFSDDEIVDGLPAPKPAD